MNKKKIKSKQTSLIATGFIAVLSVTAIISGINIQILQKTFAESYSYGSEVANANSDDHHNQPRHHHELNKHHQHHNYFDSVAFYPLTEAGVGD